MFLTRREFIGYSLGLGVFTFLQWPSWSRHPKAPNLFAKNIKKKVKNSYFDKHKARPLRVVCPAKKNTSNSFLKKVKINNKKIVIKNKMYADSNKKKILLNEKPKLILPKKKLISKEVRLLSIAYTHTGKKIEKAPYFENGTYNVDVCKALSHLLADHRSGCVKSIDPKVFDLLFFIMKKIQYKGMIEIISAYRSPKTNAKMRKAGRGVAENSYHTKAKAVDVLLNGMSLRYAHAAAKAQRMGGVGLYSQNKFLHVDTRGQLVCWGK